MTSLLILIFLTHPSNNSSRVHLSFFSIGGGFLSPVDCEYMIGVLLLLLLVFLDREGTGLTGFSVSGDLMSLNKEASVSELLLLLLLLNRLLSVSDGLPLLISLDSIGKSDSDVLLLLILLDSGVEYLLVLGILVFVTERGLGVLLLLLLVLLEKREALRVKKPSSSSS